MNLLLAYGGTTAWKLPPDVRVTCCGESVAAIEAGLRPDTEVLVTDALPPTNTQAAGLRWIHLMSAGYNQAIGHPLALRTGMRVSNAAGICAGPMAEFVVGQMLRHVKRFDDFIRLQSACTWPSRVAMATPPLRGRRALIVGYGGVGRETARLLTAMGVAVDAIQRTADRQRYAGYLPQSGMGDVEGLLPVRIFPTERLEAALASADFVILTIPLTPRTRHLLNGQTLAAMKPGAVIINVARGGLIDATALIAALDSRRVDHAYLDVFEPEPLAADSPLWAHPRITATPHMSGVMPDAAVLQEDLLRQNLVRFQAEERLLNEIAPERLKD